MIRAQSVLSHFGSTSISLVTRNTDSKGHKVSLRLYPFSTPNSNLKSNLDTNADPFDTSNNGFFFAAFPGTGIVGSAFLFA